MIKIIFVGKSKKSQISNCNKIEKTVRIVKLDWKLHTRMWSVGVSINFKNFLKLDKKFKNCLCEIYSYWETVNASALKLKLLCLVQLLLPYIVFNKVINQIEQCKREFFVFFVTFLTISVT